MLLVRVLLCNASIKRNVNMPSCLLLQLSHNTYAEVFQIKKHSKRRNNRGFRLGWSKVRWGWRGNRCLSWVKKTGKCTQVSTPVNGKVTLRKKLPKCYYFRECFPAAVTVGWALFCCSKCVLASYEHYLFIHA